MVLASKAALVAEYDRLKQELSPTQFSWRLHRRCKQPVPLTAICVSLHTDDGADREKPVVRSEVLKAKSTKVVVLRNVTSSNTLLSNSGQYLPYNLDLRCSVRPERTTMRDQRDFINWNLSAVEDPMVTAERTWQLTGVSSEMLVGRTKMMKPLLLAQQAGWKLLEHHGGHRLITAW